MRLRRASEVHKMRVPSSAISKEERVVRFRVANGRLGEETAELGVAINAAGHYQPSDFAAPLFLS